MPRVARFWDALPRFGHPPCCKQPGLCPENSGLRHRLKDKADETFNCLEGRSLRFSRWLPNSSLFDPQLQTLLYPRPLLEARLGKLDCARRGNGEERLEIDAGRLGGRTDVINDNATHMQGCSVGRERVGVEDRRRKTIADIETLDATIIVSAGAVGVVAEEKAIWSTGKRGIEDFGQGPGDAGHGTV